MSILKIYSALCGQNVPFSAMSWSGFNLIGDEESIKELKRLQHRDACVDTLQKRLDEVMKELEASKAKASALKIGDRVEHISGDTSPTSRYFLAEHADANGFIIIRYGSTGVGGSRFSVRADKWKKYEPR